MILRDYQQRSIDQLYAWFDAGNSGNPCLVLPTGSGKSHIIAALCRDALQQWPETTVLMLTHVKELIGQNAEKMRQYWPGAPLGIYSAGMGKKQLGEPITFAGIQSVRGKATELGHIDLVIIDECHLVGHKDEGGYRQLLSELEKINPALRVIGLTATPYRLGHGMIIDKPALFDALIEPVTIEELIYKGHLSVLRSKLTGSHFDISGVHKRGGEYIESELQEAVDTADNNTSVCREIMQLSGDRKAWLLFCTGVKHARNIESVMNGMGIVTRCVTGDTPKKEREEILRDFKSGKIKALTNANVLTTGFDYPDIDLIALLRPTMSPGLYVQMVGRGMRPKSHADHCLVLDFAEVVSTHGPITAVQPPKKKGGKKEGKAPTKVCAQCGEICAISCVSCPSCGLAFPEPEKKELYLRNDDIMGLDGIEMQVTSWRWRRHVSRTSGKLMVACTYYGDISDKPVTEYFAILHEGYAGDKSMRQIAAIASSAGKDIKNGVGLGGDAAVDFIVGLLNDGAAPSSIEYRMDGKFSRVIERRW